MLYSSAYVVAENNDMGYESKDEYLLINSVGYLEFNQKWSSNHRKNGRADYLMMYIHSGEMNIRLDGIDTAVKEGTVILYRPGQEQLYKHNNECPVKLYWVHFTGYGAERLLKSLDFIDENLFDTGINDEIPSLIKIMINDIQIRNSGYRTLSAALFMQVLTVISRKALRNGRKKYKNIIDDNISLSLNYINQNYMKNITVSKLSELAMLCTNRYIKVFKKELSITPKEYIIRLRLEKARELLDSTNLNIKQICCMVGIENQLYFSRLFKFYTGVTPSMYRLQRL